MRSPSLTRAAAGAGRLLLLLTLAAALAASCMSDPQPAGAEVPAAFERAGRPVDAPQHIASAETTSAVGRDHLMRSSTAAVLAVHAAAASGSPDRPLPFGGMELLPIGIGMVALAKDRNTLMKEGRLLSYPVAAGVKIYAGSLAALAAGYATPGATALNLIAIGRANEQVDNTGGADGDAAVLVERGVFLFANDGSVTQANVGGVAYIVDDQTVAATDGAGTRSEAGIIRGVEVGGVWVEI